MLGRSGSRFRLSMRSARASLESRGCQGGRRSQHRWTMLKQLIIMPNVLINVVILIIATTTTTMNLPMANAEIFTNSFLVKMKQPAVRTLADQIAVRNGFVNLGPVSIFNSIYNICFFLFVYLSIVLTRARICLCTSDGSMTPVDDEVISFRSYCI